MDIIKYAYNLTTYKYTSPKTNSDYTINLKSNIPNEDLKIEKRIKLFIKYFDILAPSTKKHVIERIQNFSYDYLKFDKELQYLISTIDESFNWYLLISLINDNKYRNFLLFIESLYSQCIFIRINNQI